MLRHERDVVERAPRPRRDRGQRVRRGRAEGRVAAGPPPPPPERPDVHRQRERALHEGLGAFQVPELERADGRPRQGFDLRAARASRTSVGARRAARRVQVPVLGRGVGPRGRLALGLARRAERPPV